MAPSIVKKLLASPHLVICVSVDELRESALVFDAAADEDLSELIESE